MAVRAIRAAREALPGRPHVAVFDTAFHATLPEIARRYPVPDRWTTSFGVRRYGFHGLSVAWSTERAAVLLGRRPKDLGLVVAHLGNGCSVTAVLAGRSVATSMGMTPLEGLMMGTRAGSIDPGIVLRLLREGSLDLDELAEDLDHHAGLLGVSGSTSDVRQLTAAAAAGDEAAALALAMFADRAAAGIAAAATALPHLDAIVFTGGIGAYAGATRAAIAERLAVISVRPIVTAETGEDRVIAVLNQAGIGANHGGARAPDQIPRGHRGRSGRGLDRRLDRRRSVRADARLGLTLRRPDDEDRAGRMTDDLVGHAADEGPSERATAMTADDDDVRSLRAGGLDDRLGRVALPDEEARRYAVAAAAQDERARRGLEPGALLVDPAPVPTAGQLERPQVDHDHREEARLEGPGEPEGLVGGGVGGGPEIGREDDLADGRMELRTEHCGCRHPPSLASRLRRVTRRMARMNGPAGLPGAWPGAPEQRGSLCVMAAPQRRTSGSDTVLALDAATRGIAGVLDIDAVLRLIVERVRDLVGSRYAALGIVDHAGLILRFVTVGIDPADRERIGDLPRGHGLLGLIIREGRSFRIPEIAAHPDSSGFPPHHPPMRSFLGVPIIVAGASVGNLYLTDKIGAAEFSEDDQALVEMFALHAGIAIENARLHAQVQRLAIVDERERIARTCTTASSRASTRSACRSRTCPS